MNMNGVRILRSAQRPLEYSEAAEYVKIVTRKASYVKPLVILWEVVTFIVENIYAYGMKKNPRTFKKTC